LSLKLSDNNFPNDNFKKHWESILSDSDIKSIPFNFISQILIKLVDGSQEVLDVEKLKQNGYNYKDIENTLNEFMREHDDEIDGIDFHLNIPLIAKEVSEKTRRLLG
jgi:hypothetical protein